MASRCPPEPGADPERRRCGERGRWGVLVLVPSIISGVRPSTLRAGFAVQMRSGRICGQAIEVTRPALDGRNRFSDSRDRTADGVRPYISMTASAIIPD